MNIKVKYIYSEYEAVFDHTNWNWSKLKLVGWIYKLNDEVQ